ncbi:MAG: MFS transporter [Oscillospiraceae bacterium]|nr:MFS transporter [Oscillospiraceae bacterium]
MLQSLKKQSVRNALLIGTLCSLSYLGVYFARNILSAVTPQIIATTAYKEDYIGSLSSLYFGFYAVGQLINGIVGDKVRARFMISFGLILAGVSSLIFPFVMEWQLGAQLIYGMTGFFLAMIYAPMTKVVAENTEPIYATRCSLGYTFASFLGSPMAGVAAALMTWQMVFYASSTILIVMGVLCFVAFLILERKGIVAYGRYEPPEGSSQGIKGLLEHRIIKFTFISVITGIVRTSVVFWMPTYFSQYLGYTPATAAGIFTATTFIMSFGTFIAVFLYEKLGRNIDLMLFLVFSASTVFFLLVYFVEQPVINIVLLVLAIMASNCAASMLWSRYCPSLRDTGMVSSATGFLDFMSYMAAAVSSMLFANAVNAIGWKNLILIWLGLVLFGAIICPPKSAKNAPSLD